MAKIDKPVKVNYVERLNKAIDASKRLSYDVNKRTAKMLRTYASGFYGGSGRLNGAYGGAYSGTDSAGSRDPHPLNMIDRAVSIMLP